MLYYDIIVIFYNMAQYSMSYHRLWPAAAPVADSGPWVS